MLVNCLITSGWAAAEVCSLKTSFCQSLTGYYLALLGLHHSWKLYGEKWSSHFLPQTTLKNICFCAAHSIVSCLFWPSSELWRPRARTESCCEYLASNFCGSSSFHEFPSNLGTSRFLIFEKNINKSFLMAWM